jgi:hypothetical protein
MGSRATALILAASATTLAGCNHPRPAAGPSPSRASLAGPSRRSGLWEQKLYRDGRHSPGLVRVCLGASPDTHSWLFAQDVGGGGRCQHSVSRGADGAYHFVSVCRLGSQAVVTSSGVARGDFSTSYEIQSVLTVQGAPLAELDGRHDLRVVGRYEGACPPGLAPGEASLGQGVTVNPRRLRQVASLFAGA